MKLQAGWVWLPGRENSSGGLREGLFLNRLTVRRVLEALTTYPNWDNLIAEYPGLEKEDIRQAQAVPYSAG